MAQSKRVKLRWNRVVIALFIIVVILFVLVLGIKALFKPIVTQAIKPGMDSSTVIEEEKPEPVRTSFLSVGDNLIHNSIYDQAKQRAGGSGYDFAYAYEKVADTIASVDVATLNQETIISPEDSPSSYPLFNSPAELGDHMVDIGFDIYNMATNHMLDVYESGLRNAINYWRAKPSVLATGGYLNQEELLKPEIYEENGLKIGVVGTTEYTNGLVLPQGSELRYILTSETELLKQKIEATKAVSDIVMVQIHWGVEYGTKASDAQRQLAQQMVDWGADVIIGHHPHVLQEVEYLTKPDGSKALIAYSLGNFISAQDRGARMVGGMLFYDIVKDSDGKCTVENAKFEAVVNHYGSRYTNIQVYKRSDYTAELANSHGVRSKDPSFSLEFIDKIVSDTIDAQFLNAGNTEPAETESTETGEASQNAA